jgi:hypothetical protein
MAEQFRRKALMNEFGIEDPETAPGGFLPMPEQGQPAPGLVQQTQPEAGPVELPGGQTAAPDYRKTGKYASTAYDAAKLARPWEEQSEKYRIGNVLSNFDPSQGLTPEVIAALNAADIYGAKFSGAGDKLTVDNAGGHERFGKGGTSDVNIGFKTGNGTWGAWTDPALEGPAAAAGGGGMNSGMAGAQSNLDGLLQGNPMAAIQAEIAKLMQGGNRPNLEALLGQFGGAR